MTTAPSWVNINSTTGVLSITAPDVVSDTEFDFYINSVVTGIVLPSQKLIKLTVQSCTSLNCQKCVSTSNTIWDIWSIGYFLNSGVWSISNQSSSISYNTAQILSTTIKSVVH